MAKEKFVRTKPHVNVGTIGQKRKIKAKVDLGKKNNNLEPQNPTKQAKPQKNPAQDARAKS